MNSNTKLILSRHPRTREALLPILQGSRRMRAISLRKPWKQRPVTAACTR